jgi:hypothetical protein
MKILRPFCDYFQQTLTDIIISIPIHVPLVQTHRKLACGATHKKRTSRLQDYMVDDKVVKQVSYVNFGDAIKKLHGLSPRANYTDQATAAYRRSDCHLLRIEGAMWLA